MTRILRWVIFLPAGIIAGYFAYLVGGFINNVSFAMFHGFLNDSIKHLLLEPVAHMYLGATTVYAAVKVAPLHPRAIAALTSALIVLISGVSAYSAVLLNKYVVFPSLGGLIIGASASLIATWRGDIEPA